MTARIFTGHRLHRDLVHQAAEQARSAAVVPRVALIRVENDDPLTPADFRLHRKVFSEAGFEVDAHELGRDTHADELTALVESLNDDDAVDVVLVLIPLPDHLDIRVVLASIAPEKEAEGLHLDHVMRLNPLSSLPPTRIPVVPVAVVHLLTELNFDPSGGQVVVLTDPAVTETNPVAKMVARVAAFAALPPDAAGTAVPVTHPHAAEIARRADLLIVSLQRPEIVTGEWVKPGATVIDFIRIFDGWKPGPAGSDRPTLKLLGGVDPASVGQVAGTLVPAVGGIGPVMLGALCMQIVTAAVTRRQAAAA